MSDKCGRGLLGVLREVTPLDYVQRVAQEVPHRFCGDCTVFSCGEETVLMMPKGGAYQFSSWHSGETTPRDLCEGRYAEDALDAWLVRVGYARPLSAPSFGDFPVSSCGRAYVCVNVCAEGAR